MSLDFFALFKD